MPLIAFRMVPIVNELSINTMELPPEEVGLDDDE